VRFALLSCLLELKRNEEAGALLKSYVGDVSADWAYGVALLEYRNDGDTATARRKLSAAFKKNSHIPPYLLGVQKIPKRLPDYVSIGDETEAVAYAAANVVGWAKTPGALEWLTAQVRQ
jgi:hypothetical protein